MITRSDSYAYVDPTTNVKLPAFFSWVQNGNIRPRFELARVLI
jgi:hypothetical protein